MVDEYRYNNHKWCKSIGVYDDKYMCWLVYYFSEVVCKWVFQCWFKHSDFGRVGVIDVDYKDIPEDMRMALDSPFFEIDMLKYCSERDLVILERYV